MSGSWDLAVADLAVSRAKPLDELVFVPQTHGSETYYHLEIPSRSRYFRIGYAEYVFLSLLDGQTTFSQAVTLAVRALGASALTQAQAIQVYSWGLQHGLLRLVGPHAPAESTRSTPATWRELLSQVNPLWLRVPLCHPDKFLTELSRGVHWLFSPASTLLSLLLVLFALGTVIAHAGEFWRDTGTILSPGNWLRLGAAWVVLKLVHELSHGLAAKRYRGTVGEFGLLFAFLAPSAYIDITSCWRFPSKWRRIHVAVAGMWSEVVLASLAALAWSYVDTPEWSQLLRDIVLMAGVTTVLFNANPLMKLDGYYILSDLLEIPNLATEGQRRLDSLLGWIFWGRSPSAPVLRGWRGWMIDLYGVAAAVWRLVFMVSVVVMSSSVGQGAGMLVGVVGVSLWLWPHVISCLQTLHREALESPWRLLRPSLVGGVCAVLSWALWAWIPWPGAISAPGIVDYQDDAVVRARASGFIAAIHAQDGEPVRAGAVLLELRNDELHQEVQEMELKIRRGEVERRKSQERGNPAETQVADNNLRALRSRLDDLKRREAALQVCAPVSGCLVARRLQERLGRYVREGEELFAVGNPGAKQLVVAIPQRHLARAQNLLRQSVALRVGLRSRTWGIVDRVSPRATRELQHPALGAHLGGPLPVVEEPDASGETSTVAVDPHFRAVITLPAAACADLHCGESGHVVLGSCSEGFGQHLWLLGDSWIRSLSGKG